MRGLWVTVQMLLMVGCIFAVAALPAVIVIAFVNGNTKAGIMASVTFLVLMIALKVWLTVSDKLKAKQEKKYRERYVTTLDTDCGRYGVIPLELDRGRDMTVSKGVLTELMLISPADMIELCVCGNMVDGIQLERIMDRLAADKERIQAGVLEAYERCYPRTGKNYPGTPLEMRLKLITVERDGRRIECEGQFTGIRDEIYATVDFDDGVFEYEFDIEE